MFRIGEFSKLSKTTIKTLRYYDKVGLLKPAFVDPETSYRYYSQEQLDVLHQILVYKNIGIPTAEILRLLDEASSLNGKDAGEEQYRKTLEKHRDKLTDSMQEIGRAHV